MTYRVKTTNGAWTVGTDTQSVKIEVKGKPFNADVTRAVNQDGKLAFVLAYEPRLWLPPVFGTGEIFIILDQKHRIIASESTLQAALALATTRL